MLLVGYFPKQRPHRQLRRAGPGRAQIRETLARGESWTGLAGPIRFNGTGENVSFVAAQGIAWSRNSLQEGTGQKSASPREFLTESWLPSPLKAS